MNNISRAIIKLVALFYIPYDIYREIIKNMAVFFKKFQTTEEYEAYTADTENFLKPNVSLCMNKKHVYYTKKKKVIPNYLKFTALESGTFTLTIPSAVTSSHLASISYSIDSGETWTTTDNTNSEVIITTPTIDEGGTVLWKGSGTQMAVNSTAGTYSNFSSTGSFQASGNIMSLLYEGAFDMQSEIEANYALCCLFRNCNTIINVNGLEFPATVLKDSCYREMFGECNNLTEVEFDLPAPNVSQNAYRAMLGVCSKLVTANVTVCASTLSSNSCAYMCYQCSQLTTAPVFMEASLASGSLASTFSGCNKLAYIKGLFTTSLGSSTSSKFSEQVSQTGVFVKNPQVTHARGVNGIPTNWTVVDAEAQQ